MTVRRHVTQLHLVCWDGAWWTIPYRGSLFSPQFYRAHWLVTDELVLVPAIDREVRGLGRKTQIVFGELSW